MSLDASFHCLWVSTQDGADRVTETLCLAIEEFSVSSRKLLLAFVSRLTDRDGGTRGYPALEAPAPLFLT